MSGAGAPDGVTAWAQVLDSYEQRLDTVLRALSAGDPAGVPPFQPPAELGPMPQAVADRARGLLVRSREIELAIASARDAVRARIHAKASAPAPPPTSTRLDISV